MQTIAHDLIEARRRERMQVSAREAFDRHYHDCAAEVFTLLGCTPDAGFMVRAILNGTQYEFERVAHALMIARASLGLEPEGHA
jgi:hypothetical protein